MAWRFTILTLFLVMSAGSVRGQGSVAATFTADRGSPLIGEPVRLTLTVNVPVYTEVTLPKFTLDWLPFMVTSVGEVRVSTDDAVARTTYQQDLIVILWKPGDYETPETFVDYRLSDSPETFRVSVEPAFFSVPSVLNPNDLTLRPLKPPLALPYLSPVLLLGILGVLVAAGLYGARWFKRQRQTWTAAVPADASSRTLNELQRIAGLALPAFRTYPLVGDALRRYVEAQFHVTVEDLTTAELLDALQTLPELNDQHRLELRRILDRVDLVKFAQYQPEADSTRKLLQAAARWVEHFSGAENGAG